MPCQPGRCPRKESTANRSRPFRTRLETSSTTPWTYLRDEMPLKERVGYRLAVQFCFSCLLEADKALLIHDDEGSTSARRAGRSLPRPSRITRPRVKALPTLSACETRLWPRSSARLSRRTLQTFGRAPHLADRSGQDTMRRGLGLPSSRPDRARDRGTTQDLRRPALSLRSSSRRHESIARNCSAWKMKPMTRRSP